VSGALTLAAAVMLAGVPLETQLNVGGSALALRSCGIRDTLWIEHYVAALYLPPRASVQAMQDADEAKAVRIRILDRRWLPRELPRKWSAALAAGLPEEPLRQVRAAYSALTLGDDVEIAYAPPRGTEMRVNGRLVARAAGHAVIDSLLATWAGPEPVAGKLVRTAARHPCPGRTT
jgi:hypothetical protein